MISSFELRQFAQGYDFVNALIHCKNSLFISLLQIRLYFFFIGEGISGLSR